MLNMDVLLAIGLMLFLCVGLGLCWLIIYILRSFGARERELIIHKEKLVDLLNREIDRNDQSLAESRRHTEILDQMANLIRGVEIRMERIEARQGIPAVQQINDTRMVDRTVRRGGVEIEGGEVRTGGDIVGNDSISRKLGGIP